jgi:hypothetical protein
VTPRLIHPVRISLVQIDPVNTPAIDLQFREPLDSPVYLDAVTITAQLGLKQTNAYLQRPGGDDPQADGHVVLRVVDFAREAPGRVLNKGDRIETLYTGSGQELSVRWHVVEVRPAAHYRGGHHFWVLFYRDLKTEAG